MAAEDEYTLRVARLAAELGIPADYGRTRGLAPQPETTDLVIAAHDPEGDEVRLTPAAAAAWKHMAAAAEADRVILQAWSGFRSVARQTEIVRKKLTEGQEIGQILQWVAAPGYSEHHTGRALDIGAPDEPPLEEGFAETTAYAWLTARAGEFGYRLSYPRNHPSGIRFEPWHWCYWNS